MALLYSGNSTRFINLLQNVLERKRGSILLKSFPYLVNSEPTNHCNFQCPFCPTGKNSGRKQGYAGIELYENIFNQWGKYFFLITLHGWGEPLLNPDIEKIIRAARRQRIFTVLTTNASRLTAEKSKALVEAGLNYIILSVDGASEITYSQYHKGGDFEKVIKNIKSLVQVKTEKHSRFPFIEWQFIVFKHNEHEIEPARKMARELGVDSLVFMPAYTEDPGWDATNKQFHLPKVSPLNKRSGCNHLWSTLSFHQDGSVVPCCYDYTGMPSYGNLKSEPLTSLWNNDFFRRSRETVIKGAGEKSKDLYCDFCIRNIGNNDSTAKEQMKK